MRHLPAEPQPNEAFQNPGVCKSNKEADRFELMRKWPTCPSSPRDGSFSLPGQKGVPRLAATLVPRDSHAPTHWAMPLLSALGTT